MGLAVSVGHLAFLNREDPEAAEWVRGDLRQVNRVLLANGCPPHSEPESMADIADRARVGSMPYGWLHHARRSVAYAMQPGRPFRALRKGEQPSEDRVYDDVLSSFASHIVCHSDGEGYYVPVDFPEPLYDDLPDGHPDGLTGGILGSSQGGLRELLLAAPLIDIRLVDGQLSDQDADALGWESEGSHPHWVARQAWLYMHERLRQSVDYKSAAVFG